MKKLTTLVLAAGLVVSAFAGSASAGEFKPVLQFAEEFSYGDAGSNDKLENFNAATRIRFGFDYVASEDLSATILFQYRKGNWGHNGDDFTADPAVDMIGAGDHFRMRLAYIDWTLPNSDVKVRMGRQAVVAPSYAFGSPVLDSRADAISINGNVNENFSLGLSWLRADRNMREDDGLTSRYDYGYDTTDAVMLNAEFAYDGFKVAPWAVYAHKQHGAESGIAQIKNIDGIQADADLYIIGASAELNMFDPFVFAVDALYNNIKYHNMAPAAEDSYDAFYVAAKASYKLSNGVASLGGWYSTGNDWENNDNGFVVLDGGFSASSVLFDGNVVGADPYTNVLGSDSPFGTWGAIVEYAGFSFVENLSHTARVLYIEGTNENAPGKQLAHDIADGLTEDDSAIEIDFDTTYQIYKNLSATLQLGYVFIDQSNLVAGAEEQDDIFRSALTFVYTF